MAVSLDAIGFASRILALRKGWDYSAEQKYCAADHDRLDGAPRKRGIPLRASVLAVVKALKKPLTTEDTGLHRGTTEKIAITFQSSVELKNGRTSRDQKLSKPAHSEYQRSVA